MMPPSGPYYYPQNMPMMGMGQQMAPQIYPMEGRAETQKALKVKAFTVPASASPCLYVNGGLNRYSF